MSESDTYLMYANWVVIGLIVFILIIFVGTVFVAFIKAFESAKQMETYRNSIPNSKQEIFEDNSFINHIDK
jgi:hypothetical protein